MDLAESLQSDWFDGPEFIFDNIWPPTSVVTPFGHQPTTYWYRSNLNLFNFASCNTNPLFEILAESGKWAVCFIRYIGGFGNTRYHRVFSPSLKTFNGDAWVMKTVKYWSYHILYGWKIQAKATFFFKHFFGSMVLCSL